MRDLPAVALSLTYGYNIVITPRTTDGVANQKMATIYNAHRFQVNGTPKGVLQTEISTTFTQNRGFEVEFIDKYNQNKPLVTTNLHLAYGQDYRDRIYEYQQEKCRQRKFCVLGGDTNNVQNENLKTAIGSWEHATNFSRDPTTGELTIEHIGSGFRAKKAYDRFFAGPSSPNTYVRTQATDRNQKVSIERSGRISFSACTIQRASRSMPGEPWRRGVDILNELSNQYRQTPNTQLLEKINECIKWKNISQQNIPRDILNATHIQGPSANAIPPAAPQIQLPETPYLNIGGMKAAPFKYSDIEPYGAFANTTTGDTYRVRQSVNLDGVTYNFNWPSSEHAYHAQKLIYLIRNNTYASEQTFLISQLRTMERDYIADQEYLPTKYKKFIEEKIIPKLDATMSYEQFNTQCGIHHKEKFMSEVIQLKLETNQDLADLAKACAMNDIIPIEISRRDGFWGTGGAGNGENKLGLIIYQEGLRLLSVTQGPKQEQPYIKSNSLSSNFFNQKNAFEPNNWPVTASNNQKTPTSSTASLTTAAMCSNANAALKQRLQNIGGDELATILEAFKQHIDTAQDIDDLNEKVRVFKLTPDYNQLKSGQSFFAKTFRFKTAAIQAMESMVQEKQTELQAQHGPTKGT